MKNKKGFTLIELLAVIIILGILMLVAIPSVTTYINNSRKSTYVDTALSYVKAAVNMVNEGKKIKFYDEATLLMIPAGHESQSMIKLESGGQSPYNSTWDYAYVGVVYDNTTASYSYYFTGCDKSGQGVGSNADGKSVALLASEKDLEDKAEELIVAGLTSTTNNKPGVVLRGWYGADAVTVYGSGEGETAVPSDFEGLLPSGVTRVIVCTNSTCA